MKLIWFCLCLILAVYLIDNYHYLLAQQSDVITGSVKISICGNGIVEGSEECDGDNLDDQTCETLGYQSGTLSCDIACDFDISGCVPYPTPTPTPTPTITPTPTPTSTPTSAPTSTPVPEEEAETVDEEVVAVETLLVTTPQPTSTPTLVPTPTPILPPQLKLFDLDGDGKISLSEKVESIGFWVDHWRQSLRRSIDQVSCDLNNDRRCDLIDFSILLYYINRE